MRHAQHTARGAAPLGQLVQQLNQALADVAEPMAAGVVRQAHVQCHERVRLLVALQPRYDVRPPPLRATSAAIVLTVTTSTPLL